MVLRRILPISLGLVSRVAVNSPFRIDSRASFVSSRPTTKRRPCLRLAFTAWVAPKAMASLTVKIASGRCARAKWLPPLCLLAVCSTRQVEKSRCVEKPVPSRVQVTPSHGLQKKAVSILRSSGLTSRQRVRNASPSTRHPARTPLTADRAFQDGSEVDVAPR